MQEKFDLILQNKKKKFFFLFEESIFNFKKCLCM